MKTNLKSSHLNDESHQITAEPLQNDLARRDGTIRGIMLNAKPVNLEQVFGLTKPTEDFSS
jgi:hypothetical protein